MPLNTRVLARLKPGRYSDGAGLYLEVKESGARSWLFRYQCGSRERWMGLGPFHLVSLAEARDKARDAKRSLLNSIDPLDSRKAQHAARALEAAKLITFEQAAKQFYATQECKWKNAKHRAQFLSTLGDYVF